jgi:hypothetical protein
VKCWNTSAEPLVRAVFTTWLAAITGALISPGCRTVDFVVDDKPDSGDSESGSDSAKLPGNGSSLTALFYLEGISLVKMCYGLDMPKPLKTVSTSGCDNCVQSVCDLFIETALSDGDTGGTGCPQVLESQLLDDYDSRVIRSRSEPKILCPLAQIPLPITRPNQPAGCETVRVDPGRIGWYYCYNDPKLEVTEVSCNDGSNNDGDPATDCGDDYCQANCKSCGNPTSQGCPLGCKPYEIVLTDTALGVLSGMDRKVVLHCPY